MVYTFNIDELLDNCTIKPVLNQIELHPFLQRRELVAHCLKNGIEIEAYSPLTQAKKLDNPTLIQVAKSNNKSVAQVLIKWSIQTGFISLPKTVNEKRLVENADVFDWNLSQDDMDTLYELENAEVLTWDPISWK